MFDRLPLEVLRGVLSGLDLGTLLQLRLVSRGVNDVVISSGVLSPVLEVEVEDNPLLYTDSENESEDTLWSDEINDAGAGSDRSSVFSDSESDNGFFGSSGEEDAEEEAKVSQRAKAQVKYSKNDDDPLERDIKVALRFEGGVVVKRKRGRKPKGKKPLLLNDLSRSIHVKSIFSAIYRVDLKGYLYINKHGGIKLLAIVDFLLSAFDRVKPFNFQEMRFVDYLSAGWSTLSAILDRLAASSLKFLVDLKLYFKQRDLAVTDTIPIKGPNKTWRLGFNLGKIEEPTLQWGDRLEFKSPVDQVEISWAIFNLDESTTFFTSFHTTSKLKLANCDLKSNSPINALLPNNIHSLALEECQLQINKPVTLPHITHLSISDVDIVQLPPPTLPKLAHLSLGTYSFDEDNSTDPESIATSLTTNLYHLSLDSNALDILSTKTLSQSPLTCLSINIDSIEHLNETSHSLSNLSNLRTLTVNISLDPKAISSNQQVAKSLKRLTDTLKRNCKSLENLSLKTTPDLGV